MERDCKSFLPPSLLSLSAISSPLKGSIASSSQFFPPSTSLSTALEIPGSSTIIPSIFTGTDETTTWVFILELHWKLTEEHVAGRLEMGDNQWKATGSLIICCYLCPVNTNEWRQVNRTKVCFPKQIPLLKSRWAINGKNTQAPLTPSCHPFPV